MKEEFKYISSTGEEKDVRDLDYQYVINALAKCYRALNEPTSESEFIKNSNNIGVLQNELLRRNKKCYEENFGSKENE